MVAGRLRFEEPRLLKFEDGSQGGSGEFRIGLPNHAPGFGEPQKATLGFRRRTEIEQAKVVKRHFNVPGTGWT
jgi:hypothetical protein